MIALLSPSKNMNRYDCNLLESQPDFLHKSKLLVNKLLSMDLEEIKQFMDISDRLAELNFNRYRSWSTPFTNQNSSPAIFSFSGNVYEGLEAKTLSKNELDVAQNKIRILSGLYGILKPFDLIQPYRLEMGKKLVIDNFKDLYQFWSNDIVNYLNNISDDTIVNLASNEYFNAVDKNKLSKKIITPIFKDYKNGKFKIISFYAKKARGCMARFIVQNNVRDINSLVKFNKNGYNYNSELSSGSNLIFTRSSL